MQMCGVPGNFVAFDIAFVKPFNPAQFIPFAFVKLADHAVVGLYPERCFEAPCFESSVCIGKGGCQDINVVKGACFRQGDLLSTAGKDIIFAVGGGAKVETDSVNQQGFRKKFSREAEPFTIKLAIFSVLVGADHILIKG